VKSAAKPSPFDTEKDNITLGVSSVITAMTGGFKNGQSSEPLYVTGDFLSVQSLSSLRVFLGYARWFRIPVLYLFFNQATRVFCSCGQHSWGICIAVFGSSIKHWGFTFSNRLRAIPDRGHTIPATCYLGQFVEYCHCFSRCMLQLISVFI
jgi:hypothetical protein